MRDDYALVVPMFVTAVGDGLLVTSVLSLLWIEFPGRRDWSIGLYIIGLYAGRILAPVVSAFTINEPSIFSLRCPNSRSIFARITALVARIRRVK